MAREEGWPLPSLFGVITARRAHEDGPTSFHSTMSDVPVHCSG